MCFKSRVGLFGAGRRGERGDEETREGKRKKCSNMVRSGVQSPKPSRVRREIPFNTPDAVIRCRKTDRRGGGGIGVTPTKNKISDVRPLRLGGFPRRNRIVMTKDKHRVVAAEEGEDANHSIAALVLKEKSDERYFDTSKKVVEVVDLHKVRKGLLLSLDNSVEQAIVEITGRKDVGDLSLYSSTNGEVAKDKSVASLDNSSVFYLRSKFQ